MFLSLLCVVLSSVASSLQMMPGGIVGDQAATTQTLQLSDVLVGLSAGFQVPAQARLRWIRLRSRV